MKTAGRFQRDSGRLPEDTRAAFSRRHFAKSLLGAVLWPACGAGAASEPRDTAADPFGWDGLMQEADVSERRYRADAQILLFGIPIYRRNGVGGGRAVWAEAGETRRKLEFTGFSDPERAAGLNRLGFIREVSSNGTEYAYFGLMTSSPEETIEAARKTLAPASGEVDFTAIDGRLGPSSVDASVARFRAPATAVVHDREDLIRSARKALDAAAKRPSECDARTHTAQPFLHALFEAIRRSAKSTTYIYGSRLYRLTLRTSADEQASAAFRLAKLLPPGGNAVKVSGKIRPATGGNESEFRIWVEAGASRPIPLRIDYRPKSYLRLTFEAAPR